MGQKPQVLQGQGGFTLIELMVTIAVFAIVVTIAAPSFSAMINNNRSVALGEELAGALNYARSEAVKRGARVSICASSNGTGCTGADTWNQGWIVFADSATSDSAASPAVGTVLRRWEAPNAGAVITVTQTAATNFIRYTRLGTLGRSSRVTVTSSVSGCGSNAARTITVGPAGLINVARGNC
ncbi:GspH/FimT family pseudopilin [Microbulbifer sp.]|uniref:GspH/FimT family pseudopilin n=1 Tax=Microbulbifer sp. TaxID=1908541 RepID=UPI003F32B07B